MKRKIIILLSCCLISINLVIAQKSKIVLTIGDKKITKSEFERIYKKNNTSTVYDNKSVEEYLELFINYKLKVFEAERLGYDTAQSFLKELNGYREKLVEPYLKDEEIYEEFTKKAYERSKTEVNVSQILVRLNNNASQDDTLKAYERIMQIRERIVNGESFDEVARDASEDPSGQTKGGQMRWFNAFRVEYPFEEAAYKIPVGEISMPFRTTYGYHIIRINSYRPARGKIKMAHIMVRTTGDPIEETSNLKAKIDEYYKMLQNGENFADVAREYSEDINSGKIGGELKPLESGVLPDSIDDVIFSLKDSGDYTEPIQTEYGWHIFQLYRKIPVGTIEEIKPIVEKVSKRSDIELAISKANVKKIKKENNFIEYKDNLDKISEIIDSSVYKGDWDFAAAKNLIEPIFKIGNMEYLQKDLAEFISKSKYSANYSFDYIVYLKYNEFVDANVLKFKKSTLEDKFPELRYLMQEYHDGILLFNLTDNVVWSKAVKDTVGLEEFFEKNRLGKYVWQQRVDVSIYTILDSTLIEKTKKLASMRAKKEISKEELIAGLCPVDSIACVEIEDNLYEEKDNELIEKITWEKHASEVFQLEDKSVLVFINNILEPEPKLLSDVRGLVTADYQTYLEKEWIKELRNNYTIEVNKKVLKKVK